jgi:aspartate/glutamate racemase
MPAAAAAYRRPDRRGDPAGRRRKVGLLGTAFTMEQDFYRGRLQDRFGLEVLVPEADDRRSVHDIIYQELIAAWSASTRGRSMPA